MLTINGEKINVTMFPDGTSQVWKVPIIETKPTRFNIQWDFESEGECWFVNGSIFEKTYEEVV